VGVSVAELQAPIRTLFIPPAEAEPESEKNFHSSKVDAFIAAIAPFQLIGNLSRFRQESRGATICPGSTGQRWRTVHVAAESWE
jgi:hypothetical protein